MALFKIQKNKLENIKEVSFNLEKDMQTLTEDNLEEIFDLEFVKSELTISNFRIDTLAYDRNSKSFVVIEYKKNKNFSVIDQGLTYLSLLLNNQAEFILTYQECCSKQLNRKDIDWSQSRVIFISPGFTSYQKEAINFKDLPIELWEIKKYSNDTVMFNQIKTAGSHESINKIQHKDKEVEKVTKKLKTYTEEDSLKIADENIKELYETFKEALLNLDDFEIKARKLYIAFALKNNVVDIHIQKKALKIWINIKSGELDDPKNIVRDVSGLGHWGNGDYEITINTDDEIEYIMSLVKQAVRKLKKS